MTVSSVSSGAQTFNLMALSEQASSSIAGNSGAEVAALLVQSARDEQKQARTERQAEEKRLTSLEAQQVECLLEQADAVRSAGQLRALGLMASGGCAIAGGVAGLDGADAAQGSIYQGGGQAAEAGANLVAADYDFAAKSAEAEGARATNAGHQSQRRMDELSAAARESGDAARDALQTASALVQAEGNADRATLYLRG